MILNNLDFKKIKGIVNKAIRESEFNNHTITLREIDKFDGLRKYNLIELKNNFKNPFNKIFNSVSKNQLKSKDKFFHFKSYEFATEIINKKSIQVSNILSNGENDFSEYSEFYKRLGLFTKLVPKNYCINRKESQYEKLGISKIEEERKNIFILCFTKKINNKRFWDEYASNDHGVCIAFKIKEFNKNMESFFDFRDVCYDNGYRFDFINQINYFFIKSFNRNIFIAGITKFSKFYKRNKYKWENETRLSFDFNGPYKNTLLKEFKIQEDIESERKYINFSLDTNSFLTLTIDEVICGRNLSDFKFNKLKDILQINFPVATIRKRE